MTGRLTNRGSIPDKDEGVLFCKPSRQAPEPTQPPTRRIPAALSQGEADRARSYASSTFPYFFVALCLTTRITVPVRAELYGEADIRTYE